MSVNKKLFVQMNGKWTWKSKLQQFFAQKPLNGWKKAKRSTVYGTFKTAFAMVPHLKDVASGQKQNNWGRRSFMKSVVDNRTC